MVHLPGFEGARAAMARCAVVGRHNVVWNFANHRASRYRMRAVVACKASCRSLRVVEHLGRLPSGIVGHVTVFAEIGGQQMRCIFACDRLGGRGVAAIMAREAAAHHEGMEAVVERGPSHCAGVAAGASVGAGQDVLCVFALGIDIVVALFASLAHHTRIGVIEGQRDWQPSIKLRCAVAVIAGCRSWNMSAGLARSQLAVMA